MPINCRRRDIVPFQTQNAAGPWFFDEGDCCNHLILPSLFCILWPGINEVFHFSWHLEIFQFTNKQMHCKWIFNLMQWGQKFILQQHACQPSNKEFPLFYLKWNVLLGNTPRKNWGIHIAAFLSRQPLVKGERLVRYEVNAVIKLKGSKQGFLLATGQE